MKKNILVILLTFLAISCNTDEYLDVVPTGYKIPTTVEDFDKLLEDHQTANPAWANVYFMDPDIILNNTLYNSITKDYQKKQYQWSRDPWQDNDVDNDWKYRYTRIYVYNLIIQHIDDAPLNGKTEIDRKRVKGQAYAQRAYAYFFLVNEYGPHYSATTLDVPAIPMPLVPDLVAQLPRSTVGEVYKQMEKDISIAEPLLANHTAIDRVNFRPGRASILGFKAWMALYKGDFKSAKDYADQTLSLFSYMYDYTQLKNKTTGNAWSGLTNTEFGYGTTTKDVIWGKYFSYYFNSPGFLYNPNILGLYDQTNDYRFKLFSSNVTSSGVNISPNVAYARVGTEAQVGLTTPEVLMISAEAHARTGDAAIAIDRINTLLKNRLTNFRAYTTSDFTSDAQLLQFIKNERRKEFFATGKNWFDLKRYHAYGETIPTFTRVVNGQTYTLTPGSDSYVLPIAPKTLNLNPNLK